MNVGIPSSFRRSSVGAVVGLCLLPIDLRAQAVVFTESGTSLTETYNGSEFVSGTIGGGIELANGYPQIFFVAWPAAGNSDLIQFAVSLAWQGEPYNSAVTDQPLSQIYFSGFNPLALDGVFSESGSATVDVTPYDLVLNDGLGDNVQYPVTTISFVDLDADVPETTRTLMLAAIAFLSLVVMRRCVTPHTAAA
jgi:hypothetical protein